MLSGTRPGLTLALSSNTPVSVTSQKGEALAHPGMRMFLGWPGLQWWLGPPPHHRPTVLSVLLHLIVTQVGTILSFVRNTCIGHLEGVRVVEGWMTCLQPRG